MYRRLAIVLVAIAFLGWHSRVNASLIPITNAGFEAPVTSFLGGTPTGWTLTGAGGGVWNINASPVGFWSVPAPEGNQIGWLSPAPLPGAPATFSQVLSDALAANTLYTLTGEVGHPLGYGSTPTPDTIYTVELLAGGNLLASTSGTGPEAIFAPFSVGFDSTGSSYVGLSLEIRLSSSQAQTGFDNLALNAVPLPPSLLLLGSGLLGLVGLRRFRKS